LSWLLKRRFRSGQTHGRIVGTGKSAGRRLLQGTLALGKSLYCAFAMLALAAAPVRRNRFALRAILHAGAVTGLLGIREIRQYGLVEAS
jgi:succinoglycan biosynthesis protein ExoM